ncbi:four helix bundle protein [Carboxylicivirga sp. N1Y90]|uniref:four helix bundle protein n=1 Tax=Carboxylicivirga fragile TaxID=3417571 RepID=UPI003D3419DA|nr:four helix bundle protein [Marinilabiliaceae bacterium N1Y90]
MVENDLQRRLFDFSVNVIKQVRQLPNGKEYQVISYQILKSATSVGANYEEAQAAVSKADFSNKVGISLKEIRETNYWIRIIIAVNEGDKVWKALLDESTELKKILGSIYSKTSKPR